MKYLPPILFFLLLLLLLPASFKAQEAPTLKAPPPPAARVVPKWNEFVVLEEARLKVWDARMKAALALVESYKKFSPTSSLVLDRKALLREIFFAQEEDERISREQRRLLDECFRAEFSSSLLSPEEEKSRRKSK